jgi:hypothetical protein
VSCNGQYYNPLAARLEGLGRRYREDPAALAVAAECEAEIETYRRFGDWYGYAFFIAQKPRALIPCRAAP